MIPDLSWLRNQLDITADSATAAKLKSDGTNDFLNDILGLWNDTLSCKMRMRYLSPIADHHENTAEHLRLQREELDHGLALLHEAANDGRDCMTLSGQIVEVLADALSVNRLLESLYSEIDTQQQEALRWAGESGSLAEQADQAGNLTVARQMYIG